MTNKIKFEKKPKLKFKNLHTRTCMRILLERLNQLIQS